MENSVKSGLKFRAYLFSVSVIKFVGTVPANQIFRIIIDQLIRSSTSIGANIVEAQSASSKREFSNYYCIALKSANETKYWLCLLRDATGLSDKSKIELFLKEVGEISKVLGASILTLKNKRKL